MYLSRLLVVLFTLVILPTMGYASAEQNTPAAALLQGEALVRALQKGGYIIYLRHAATEHAQVDTDRMTFENCQTQRNLSEEGRQQSRTIGQVFTTLGIRVAQVLTSPYCRCVETGKLAFGQVTVSEGLHFAMGAGETEIKTLAAYLRKLLGSKPPRGANTVVVSHTANLREAAGIWPKPEGVAHIFQPHGDGGFSHMGMVLPHEWVELARLTRRGVDLGMHLSQ